MGNLLSFLANVFKFGPIAVTARNIVYANVDVTAYAVAASYATNDNVTNVKDDVVLLMGQTTVAENGVYVVGPVTNGVAPLTRVAHLRAGKTFKAGGIQVSIASGGNFRGSLLESTAASAVLGTDDPLFRFTNMHARGVEYFTVRQVVHANVADLSAYVVTADANLNDNLLSTTGSYVLLIGQTNPVENGVYIVGPITSTTAPLVRHPLLAAGRVYGSSAGAPTVDPPFIIGSGGLGAVYSKMDFYIGAAAGAVVGTTDLQITPMRMTQTITLSSGAKTISNCPLKANASVHMTRVTASGCTSTVQYVLNGDVTAGGLGTAAINIMAAVAAGTVNAADGSTLRVTIVNR